MPAVGAYAKILEPPVSVCDVTYWLNYLAQQKTLTTGGKKLAAINTAGAFMAIIVYNMVVFLAFTTPLNGLHIS